MEGLLHSYGIFTAKVVAVIRYISDASWCASGIDWPVE
jgi:hypothetical protein